MRVKATAAGWCGEKLREKGEIFDLPDGSKLGSWMEKVVDVQTVPPKVSEQKK